MISNLINKKAEMSLDLLIKILIGLFILVGVFYFLFGNSIWDYVRGLPEWNKNIDKDMVVVNISDEKILVNYYKVGVILDGKYVKLCSNGDCNNLKDTQIYISGDVKSGGIYTDINWAFDKRIGNMVNSRMIIDSDIFDGKGAYPRVKNELPAYDDLRNLDNSIYISGILYRDKKYVLKEGEKIFGVRFSYMEKDDESFGQRVRNIFVGENLLVPISYSFPTYSGKIVTTDILIQKQENGEFLVFAYYLDSAGNEQSHQLNCNKNGWIGKTLTIVNIKETLAETLDKNCKW